MSVWDRLRPRKPAPRPADQPTDQPTDRPADPPAAPPRAAVANPELDSLIERGVRGEPVDPHDALLRATLVVPSGGAVGREFEGFVPVLFDRGGTPMLAAFTSLERAEHVTHLARFAVTMSGRDLVLRMPGDHGLVVNPGHELGFELFPDAVRAVAGRARAGGQAAAPQPASAPGPVAVPEAWAGARWQVELLPPGAARPSAVTLDATTTPEAHAWATAIRERLAAAGVEAQLRQDDGEDGRGNPTTYDELVVTVGEGYMALAFWRGAVAWTVDVFPDQADRGTVARVASHVLGAVEDVTGYVLDPERLGPDERSLLGG